MIRDIKARFEFIPHSLAAVVLFGILTIIMTWPLVLQMDSAVIGWVGDNFFFVWMVGWFQKALFVLNASPLHDPYFNYPEGYNLVYTDVPIAMVFIGLPVSILSNPTAGYNFSMLASFVLSGLGVYIWVRRVTHSSAAGVIAGAAFAFVPFRMSHLFGHLHIMGTQWLVFWFMSLSELLEMRRWSWRKIFLASLWLGFIGLTAQYYLYMTLILSSGYVLCYFLLDRKLIYQSELWKRFGAFSLFAIPLISLSLVPHLQLASRDTLRHSLEDVRMWSASLTDFILPSRNHFLWGEWIAANFDRHLWVENTLYLGVVPVLFAAIALFKARDAFPRWRIQIKVVFITACIASVLALGTHFYWLGRPVPISVPEFFQRWYPHAQMLIPLPGYFFFRLLPFYDGMRVWMRYGIFVSLFLSVLAGVGTAWLLSRTSHRYHAPVVATIFLIALVDFYPGVQSLTRVDLRPVDAWLASQGDGAIVQYPNPQILDFRLEYASLYTSKPMIGDPFGAFATVQARRIGPVLNLFPNQSSVTLLRELGVRWIVVDSGKYADWSRAKIQIESLGFQPRIVLDELYVYELE